MSAVLGSLIAVVGTLLGSFSTYLFQWRTALRAETATRDGRLRQERLAACSEFAAAVTELKRGVIAQWFLRDSAVADYQAAFSEADRLGAVTENAKYRMLLVTDDPTLGELADAAIKRMDPIRAATNKTELEAQEAEFTSAMSAFIATAALMLR